MLVGLLAFTAIITVFTVTDCGMCAAGRLAPWVDIMAGISLAGSGLFLRVRRPDNALWILLIVAGLGRLFELTLVQLPISLFVPWHGTRNLLLVAVPWHIALVFPTGRSLRRFRWVVPSVYAWAITATVIRALVVDREALALRDAPNMIAADVANPERWQIVLDLLPQWGNLNILLAVAAILTRWITGNRAIRRAFATMFIALPFVALQALSDVLPFIPAVFSTWATQLTPLAIPLTVVLGVVGPRLWEGRISILVDDLDAAATPRDVESAARRALEDPAIEVATRLPLSGAFVDVAGQSIEVDLGDSSRATPIGHEGEMIGALLHPPTADLSLMQSVARTVALALRRIQLQARVQAQLVEVQRSRQRIVTAGDEARRGVERDLHDGAQQSLVALAMALDLEKSRFHDPQVRTVLEDAASQAREALEEIRRLSRGMYPPALESDGLGTAIAGIADASPVPVEVCVPDARFEPKVEAAAYFIVAEALTNLAKHAKAHTARVEIVAGALGLVVQVSDDGVGGATMSDGSGLQGLEDRVEAIGGTFTVHSPPEGGTTLLATIPL